MPIDANIPLSFRAPPMDVFGAYEQGQRISANELAYAGNQRVDDMQQVAYRDQLMARAARMGAASPQDWDRAFGELAQKFPGAERYIGQWSPDAAERLMGGIGGAGPQQPGQGIGSAGAAPGARQGQNQPAQSGGPTGPQIDLNSVSPEERRTRYANLSAGIRALNNVRSASDFEKFFDEMREVIPNVEQIRDSLRSTSQLNDLSWASSAQRLQNNWKAVVAQLEPIIMAEAGGMPIREAQPGYDVKMSEAGPLLQTTPLGGGPPSMDFMDIGGTGRKEFMPAPRGGGGAGGADVTLNEPTLRRMADQYLAGDKSVFQNLGRGRQGAANVVALREMVGTVAEERGMSGRDIARVIGEFEGFKAGQRTIGTRAGAVLMAATEAGQMAQIVLETSDAVDRTQFPDLNAIAAAVRKGTGNPEIVAFNAAVNSFINVYARAIAPTGQGPTVSDKEHARELLESSFSDGQVEAAINVLLREIDLAKKTPGQVKKGFGQQMGYGGGVAEPEPEADKNTPEWAR